MERRAKLPSFGRNKKAVGWNPAMAYQIANSSPSRKDLKDLPERAQSKETELDVKWLLWKKAKKKRKKSPNQTNLSLFFKPLLGKQGL